MTKNIGVSIKTRLLNLSKKEKQEYMKVLVKYLHSGRNKTRNYLPIAVRNAQ